MGGEEKTFKVNFTSDGIEKLQNEVTEKLKEFMGDYTDDTLVEYVIVLLRNGRTKDEARNELNVFLGDEDSNLFVTWLWDHLSANLNLYAQSDDSGPNVVSKKKSGPRDPGISQVIQNPNYGSQKDRDGQIADNVGKNTENQHSEYAAKASNLRSVIGLTHFEEKNRHERDRTRNSVSPQPSSRRKRHRVEERHHPERNVGLLSSINPSSRLLQSAVREAVGTVGLTSKTTDPSAKRLRSVVATSTVDDSRRRVRSVATVASSIAGVALKAAAEAAEDVLRVRPSGNVFDRLGRVVDVVERTTDFTDTAAGEEHEFNDQVVFQSQFYQHPVIEDSRRYAGEYINHETEFTIDMDEDDNDEDEIDEADGMGYRNCIFQTSTSAQMDNDSATTRHGNIANSYRPKSEYQNQLEVHPSYGEYVNADLRKPRPYMQSKKIGIPNSSRVIQGGDVGQELSGGQPLKKNINGLVGIGNGKSALLTKSEMQKAPSGATAVNVEPQEDADSRTIFVSNVHFAATKDILFRHFTRFGQVLRATILADAATGLPRGAAYVEFMQKEAAVQATSLDGTSFMSRIIKVCMKGSAQPETPSPATTVWPRAVPRGSPYPVPRFSRSPFPRGNPNSFGGRGLARPGARSLQWKRDAQPVPGTTSIAAAGVPLGNSIPVRSLTYVRPELKSEGAST